MRRCISEKNLEPFFLNVGLMWLYSFRSEIRHIHGRSQTWVFKPHNNIHILDVMTMKKKTIEKPFFQIGLCIDLDIFFK